MEQPVDRVFAEVGHDHDFHELQRQRLRSDDPVEPPAAGNLGEHRRRHHREQRRHLDEQMAHEEVQRVGGPARAEDLLLLSQREEPLERNEDRREQQQVQEEPVETQVEPAAERPVDRHVCTAQQQRRQRQRQPGDRQGLASAEQRREQAEEEAGADDNLNQRADDRHRIVRAKIHLREERRVMQADDCAQAERAEEDRRRAAEPAGA